MTTFETRRVAGPACEPQASMRAESRQEVALASWVGTNALGQVITQAVRHIEANSLRRVAPADAGPAYRPLTLLALVTYCYTLEIYSSAEIEDMMRRDAGFRMACRNEFPDGMTLRRFRRQNREAIQQCLVETFRRLRDGCRPREAALPASGGSSDGRSLSARPSCPNCQCRAHLAARGVAAPTETDRTGDQALVREAQRRLETATWIDHMILED